MSEREILIDILIKRPYWLGDFKGFNKDILSQAEVVADFILADRLRIVEPAIKHKEILQKQFPDIAIWGKIKDHEVIDEMLKNAGVEL